MHAPPTATMRSYTLHRRQRVPGRLEAVFDFFKRPENLDALTPPWLGLKIRFASDREIRVGTRIHYDLRWLGLPLRWETLITDYRENERFVDEMVKGPYRNWKHSHRFLPVEGGVEIEDHVAYAMRLGPLGRLAHAAVVGRQLDRIFYFRARQVERLFGVIP